MHNKEATTPKDASATILFSRDYEEMLWAKRNPKLKFLGGFHGFIGGKVERSDAESDVRNLKDISLHKNIACAARELFEEVGILLVRNGDKLTKGQRASLHDDLISGRSSFTEILDQWGLWIDAEDFTFFASWTTPEFSRIRFNTRFFTAVCPSKQKPFSATNELQNVEFIKPEKAIDQWANSKVLIVPPVLSSFRYFKKVAEDDRDSIPEPIDGFDDSDNGEISSIELNSHIVCVPLKTKTLPPATHTNCFIVGGKEFIVIDAAAKHEIEREKLFKIADKMIEAGSVCKEIVVSHLHADHFGGETVLKRHLKKKFKLDVPISAHKLTGESLNGLVEIDHFIDDNHTYKLQDEESKSFDFTALHTPGHARGHLCFYDEEFGFLLSSDNVVGQGTVVIAPPEGNMIDYLESLKRMKNLPNLNFLCGSHGAAVFDAKGKIESYIDHRLDREKQILNVIEKGAKTNREIVDIVYRDLNPVLIPLAEKSVEAHLEKLNVEGILLSTDQN